MDAIEHSLKPGGILAYSTCTFAPLEDEIQIANLLSEYPEFELMDVPVFEYFDKGHAEWLTDEYMSDISDSIKKCARLWPHKIEGEGHFICVLRKSGEPDDNTSDRSSKQKKEKNNNQIDRKSFEIVEKFFQENIKGFSLTREDVIVSSEYVYMLPSGIDRELKKNGLEAEKFELTDDALRLIIKDYTREAGVRQLERHIGTLMRKAIRKI